MRALLQAAVAEGIPGLSVAIARGSEVVCVEAAGLADIETGQPIGSEMLFGLGSITKTFVAVLCLQLIEEGMLKLEDTPSAILDASFDGIPNARCATVRDLLAHTSGIPSWEDDRAWIREARGAALDVDLRWGKADSLAYVQGKAPLHAPGAAFSYSNSNYTLLGLMLEKVTGEDLIALIECRIRQRLGLKDIHLEGFEDIPRHRLPRRYHWATPEFSAVAGINAAFPLVRADLIDASASNLSVEWAAGGLLASAPILALYGTALRDGRLLAPHSMQILARWRPVAAAKQVGHGLFRDVLPEGGALVGHDGGVLGFSATLFWIEGTQITVAVLSNAGGLHAGPAIKPLNAYAKSPAFLQVMIELASKSAAGRPARSRRRESATMK